jgi:hypothetical protein
LLYPLSYRPAQKANAELLSDLVQVKRPREAGVREEEQRRRGGLPKEDGAEKGLWVAEYKVGNKKKYLYGKTKKAVTDKLSSGEVDLAPVPDTMRVE